MVLSPTSDPKTDVTLRAPANDPGWNNVAHLSSATAVYLGNRWMITANHVGETPVTFSDGRVFNITVGSDVVLSNPASTGDVNAPDLRMFQLTADPGLPSLNIAASAPAPGTLVTMIGAGLDRGRNQIGFQVTGTSPNFVWTPAPLPIANARGFSLLSSSHMRWGQSPVVGTPNLVNDTVMFATRFAATSGPLAGQAVSGDSGGGVFQLVHGAWSLVGIMDLLQPVLNQPSGLVVFGDQTFSNNLSTYRDQIMSLVTHPTSAWQNQLNHFDVNRSGSVTAQDLLVLISDLQMSGPHSLVGTPGAKDALFDVNGDGVFDAKDEAELQDVLKTGIGNPSALAHGGPNLVPEPSSVVLALSGLLVIALARRLTIARRKRADNVTVQ